MGAGGGHRASEHLWPSHAQQSPCLAGWAPRSGFSPSGPAPQELPGSKPLLGWPSHLAHPSSTSVSAVLPHLRALL